MTGKIKELMAGEDIMEKEVLYELKNVTKVYGEKDMEVKALEDVNLTIYNGDFIVITGESGGGKSTLLHIIAGIDSETDGVLLYKGKELKKFSGKEKSKYRSCSIGYVYQDFDLIEELTVRENILMPALIAKKKDYKDRYEKIVTETGIKDRETHYPSQISGGQKQRAAIARALINSPSVILADEPTGNLDSETSKAIMDIFKRLNREGQTIILVTHDVNYTHIGNRSIRMNDGRASEV